MWYGLAERALARAASGESAAAEADSAGRERLHGHGPHVEVTATVSAI